MSRIDPLIEKMFTFLRCMKEQMSLQSDVLNLSMMQLHTLFFIKQNPESPMKNIAEYLKVELPSATTIVEKLVKLNYVKRTNDKDDRRLVLINLTSKGESLLTDAMTERAKNMKKILSHLSEKDIDHLSQIVDTLIVAMEEKEEKDEK